VLPCSVLQYSCYEFTSYYLITPTMERWIDSGQHDIIWLLLLCVIL